MEGLGWDDSQVFSNISSLWGNQENQEAWIHASNSSSCIFSSKNMEITGDFFNNHQFHGFQKSRTSLMNANSDECQDTSKMVVDTSLEKSGASTQELPFSSPSLGNGFGMNNQSRIINGCLPVSTSSLDCLLSATNSNTDTSIEDDMIFSDCRNLWSFGANSAAAASSGESENSTCNARNREMHHYLQETVSQNTSLDKRSYSQTTKPVHPKRTNDQTELKVSYFDLLQTDSTTNQGGFELISENQSKPKKPRSSDTKKPMSTNINFQQPSNSSASSSIDQEQDQEAIAQMKEMIYIAAAFRPVNLGLEIVEKPKRKNVKISTDPQTVAARQRRERISERIRVLQRLVPGGNKMDTATMLDEAANYLKFLISQVKALENLGHKLEVNYPRPPTNNIALSSLPFNTQSTAPSMDEMRW